MPSTHRRQTTQNGSCAQPTASSSKFRGAAKRKWSAFCHQRFEGARWNANSRTRLILLTRGGKNPQEQLLTCFKTAKSGWLPSCRCSNCYVALSAIWLWFLSTAQCWLCERLADVSGQDCSSSEQRYADWEHGVRTIITDFWDRCPGTKSKHSLTSTPSLPPSLPTFERVCSIPKPPHLLSTCSAF